ncbi:MAG: hypothetical protein AAFR31_16235 [Cyanobacteria bacterium J06627_8]
MSFLTPSRRLGVRKLWPYSRTEAEPLGGVPSVALGTREYIQLSSD